MSADPWASEKSVQGRITFKLASRREVRVRSFGYSGTYDGLLEGVPTRLMNEQLIERYLQSERRIPNDPAPYFVTPLTREVASVVYGFLPSVAETDWSDRSSLIRRCIFRRLG